MHKGLIMKKLLTTIALLCFSVAALSACSPDEWEGFIYPNSENLSINQNIGIYESLESCRVASIDRLAQLGASNRGTYECGLNCRPTGYQISICEETRE